MLASAVRGVACIALGVRTYPVLVGVVNQQSVQCLCGEALGGRVEIVADERAVQLERGNGSRPSAMKRVQHDHRWLLDSRPAHHGYQHPRDLAWELLHPESVL